VSFALITLYVASQLVFVVVVVVCSLSNHSGNVWIHPHMPSGKPKKMKSVWN
jgi:hypothetical protein